MTFKKRVRSMKSYFQAACESVSSNPYAAALKKFIFNLCHYTGLRQRDLLTRDDRLRLRYVVTPAIFLFMGLPVLLAFATNSSAVGLSSSNEYAYIQPAAGSENDISSLLNGSRYGQLSLASATVQAIPKPTEKIVTIKSGDALGKVMQNAGVGGTDTHKAIEAMTEYFDPRHLRVGQDIQMRFDPTESGDYTFAKMKIELDPIKTILVSRGAEGFVSEVQEKPVERVVRANEAKIEVSLYGSAEKAGIPTGVISEAIRIYSWNIDFQRDIRQGDKIEVLYDNMETSDGYIAKTGNILYAKLTLGDKEIPLYRYEMQDGRIDYFDREGRSIKRTLMKTPIDGARMSSGFGMRHHPVLGYNKMHKGIDFAASTGTPIYAAGDGVVERAGRFSSYGNYVAIRHNSQLKTAYGHMSKINVRSGERVTQGDIIGYVGATGRATGPHLHYEVLQAGAQVNPNSINLPTGETLDGEDLRRFKSAMKESDQEYAAQTKGMNYAQRETHEARRYN